MCAEHQCGKDTHCVCTAAVSRRAFPSLLGATPRTTQLSWSNKRPSPQQGCVLPSACPRCPEVNDRRHRCNLGHFQSPSGLQDFPTRRPEQGDWDVRHCATPPHCKQRGPRLDPGQDEQAGPRHGRRLEVLRSDRGCRATMDPSTAPLHEEACAVFCSPTEGRPGLGFARGLGPNARLQTRPGTQGCRRKKEEQRNAEKEEALAPQQN